MPKVIGRGGIFVRAREHSTTVLDRRDDTDDGALGSSSMPRDAAQPAASHT